MFSECGYKAHLFPGSKKEDVKQEDIKAKFENGTLILTVPKKVQQPVVEENKYIAIE